MAAGDPNDMSGIVPRQNKSAYVGHGQRRAPSSFFGQDSSAGLDRLVRRLLLVAMVALLCFLAARLCQLAANRVLSYAFLCSLLVHYIARPPRRDFVIAGLLGAAVMAAYWLSHGRFYPVLDLKIFDLTAFAGIGSIILLSWQWTGARDPEETVRRRKLFRSAAAMPVCCLLSYIFFAIFFTSGKIEYSWDSLLYRFDLRLGAPWSFWLGQSFEKYTLLRDLSSLVYQSVLLGLGVLYVALRRQIETLPVNTVAAFLVGTVAGVMCYFAVPGAGPFYVFPGWPLHPPTAVVIGAVAVTGLKLNALPSMHTFFALLVLWNSRAGGRLLRLFGILFFALTELATLGLGEHYLIDLVATLPFAIAIEALCARGISWREPRRYVAFLSGAILFLGWLLVLRSQVWLAAPVPLLWAGVILSVVLPFVLERRLTRYGPLSSSSRAFSLSASAQPPSPSAFGPVSV